MADNLERLRELEKRATPGPFDTAGQNIYEPDGDSVAVVLDRPDDLALLVTARNTFSLLLDLWEAVASLRAAENMSADETNERIIKTASIERSRLAIDRALEALRNADLGVKDGE